MFLGRVGKSVLWDYHGIVFPDQIHCLQLIFADAMQNCFPADCKSLLFVFHGTLISQPLLFCPYYYMMLQVHILYHIVMFIIKRVHNMMGYW